MPPFSPMEKLLPLTRERTSMPVPGGVDFRVQAAPAPLMLFNRSCTVLSPLTSTV